MRCVRYILVNFKASDNKITINLSVFALLIPDAAVGSSHNQGYRCLRKRICRQSTTCLCAVIVIFVIIIIFIIFFIVVSVIIIIIFTIIIFLVIIVVIIFIVILVVIGFVS